MSETIYNSLSYRPQNRKCNEHFVKRNNELKQERIEAYNKKPTTCKTCKTPIEYERRHNKFCGSSCAAKHTNATRKPCKTGPAKSVFPFSKVTFDDCPTCGKTFRKTKGAKYCSSVCNTVIYEKVRNYRNACRFKLNKRDHPELFDGDLISEYGWYQPASKDKPNLNGVVWDHLYPLHEGYKNKVPPEIMSHPANAELVPQQENLRRYHKDKSQITYEQLLERIEKWEEYKKKKNGGGSGNRTPDSRMLIEP